jgi:hypothetical protein
MSGAVGGAEVVEASNPADDVASPPALNAPLRIKYAVEGNSPVAVAVPVPVATVAGKKIPSPAPEYTTIP